MCVKVGLGAAKCIVSNRRRGFNLDDVTETVENALKLSRWQGEGAERNEKDQFDHVCGWCVVLVVMKGVGEK